MARSKHTSIGTTASNGHVWLLRTGAVTPVTCYILTMAVSLSAIGGMALVSVI